MRSEERFQTEEEKLKEKEKVLEKKLKPDKGKGGTSAFLE